MNKAVSPWNALIVPSSVLALSMSRSEVEPAATIRPPARRAALSACAVCALTLPCSACMRWAAVSAALTGRNVPAPTCSVTLCSVMPRCVRREISASVKCSPRRRRRYRTFHLCEYGLIVHPIALVGGAPRGDVGRQRHSAALVHGLVEHGPVESERQRHLAAVALRLHCG